MLNYKTSLVEHLAGKRATHAELKAYFSNIPTAEFTPDVLADILLNFQWYVEQRAINAYQQFCNAAARNLRDNLYVNEPPKH